MPSQRNPYVYANNYEYSRVVDANNMSTIRIVVATNYKYSHIWGDENENT